MIQIAKFSSSITMRLTDVRFLFLLSAEHFNKHSLTPKSIFMMSKTTKTRLCMISDTHTRAPLPERSTSSAYREPLPKADILLHAGDITMIGRIQEYETMIEVLNKAEAELKIVIAGNHDITLDEEFYCETGMEQFHRYQNEDLNAVKELWTGAKAKQANIVYLEEGLKTFGLKNGARFTVSCILLPGYFCLLPFVLRLFRTHLSTMITRTFKLMLSQIYTSPWQPEYDNWAFNYPRSSDRFNPSAEIAKVKAVNPVPSWPEIDIMLTHGPPSGILDTTRWGESAGCQHLRRAVQRCRPRVHCFGHIHEGWGAIRMNWSTKTSERVIIDREKTLVQRSAYIDLTDSSRPGLKFGDETLFVNAAVLDQAYRPVNAPWVVDLDLPLGESSSSSISGPDIVGV